MPGPDPTAVWIEEGWNGRLTATYEVFLATNLSARKRRALAILRNVQCGGWLCRWCAEPVPHFRRADPQKSCEVAAARAWAAVTGAELRAHRRAAGLSQVQLAALSRVGRQTVQYWEAKPFLHRGWGLTRILGALGLPDIRHRYARAGGWGLTPTLVPDWQLTLDAEVKSKLAQWQEREAARAPDIALSAEPRRARTPPAATRVSREGAGASSTAARALGRERRKDGPG